MAEPRVIRKVKSPHDCYIILTARCNQRCLHCYGNYGMTVPDHELTGKEWDEVFKDLVDNNVFYINISGGEPTIHPDILDIFKSLKKYKLHFILTTNGLFDDKILNTLVDLKDLLIGLKVSLDGPDYISNGFIRRNTLMKISEDDFNKTLGNLYSLRKKNIPYTIATCLHKGNIKKLDNMLNLILELKPVSWYISTISTSGRSIKNLDIFVSDSEVKKSKWDKINKVCNQNDIYVNYIDMPFASAKRKTSKFYYECPAAQSFCEINSDGLVSPCPLARVSIPSTLIEFENIKEKSIKDIWNGKAFKFFLELSKRGCSGCQLKNKCDRCIPQSIQWFNDPSLPPPFCIQNARILGLNRRKELENLLLKKSKEYIREKHINNISQ